MVCTKNRASNVYASVARWYNFKPKKTIWVNVGIFYAVYMIVIMPFILRPFGTFYGHFAYFFPFWYIVSVKIWQPRSTLPSIIAGYESVFL
jgi:hypothetical protein